MITWKFPKYLFINVLINSLENCQALQWAMNKMKKIIPAFNFLYIYFKAYLKISHKLYL